MQLRRIEISEFRKLGRRTIEGLADGLNIVVGDNEAGKSTVLAALRAAFFERHRVSGGVADAMLPYGGTGRPTVSVDFEIGGGLWRLVKSFCQRPEALLEGPGERLAGDAVEDRLSTLFGFTPPGRGGSKPDEHHGVHGLLWVEQGLRPNLGVGAGRETLAAALEREVGQVTGGERGRALVALAEERRDRFWDKRDRLRGAPLESRRHVEDLEREQAELHGRRQSYEDKLAQLERTAEILARHARDDRLARAAAAVAAARGALVEAERHGAAADTAALRRRDAEQLAVTARERQAARAALVGRREAARALAEKAGADAEETLIVGRRHDHAVREAERRLDDARRALAAAEARAHAVGQALRRHELEAALERQREALAAAERQDVQRRDALARAAAITVDAAAVAALASLEKAADRARTELGAAGVQVRFEPDGARQIVVGGVAHPADQPLALARDTTVELQGFGRIHLRPGGGTAELGRKAEGAELSLREALARHGVLDIAAARQLQQERGDREAEAAAAARALAVLAPGGLEALRQAVDEARARLARLPAPVDDGPVDAQALAEAETVRDDRRARAAEADGESRAMLTAQVRAAAETAALNERRNAAARQLQALGDDLAAARAGADDDLLDRRAAAAEIALGEARAIETAALRSFAEADVETARLTLERLERGEAEIRRDIAALEGEQRDLRVELRAVGQDGVGERLAAIEGELASARVRLATGEREAAASRLLHETLLAAQREARERWLGPVRRRVEPYLRLIHPESEIRMDDRTLEIEGLVRGGVLEQFGALSMGAREQVAVVTRLALADVLRAAGHPAAVILDDALVNTDEARLDRMHNVLARAARELQILIFTCRERDFLGLGATHRM